MKKNKLRFAVLLLLLAVTMLSFVQAKKRIVFFGDSITQQGAQPGGYIRKMDSLLQEKGLEQNYELVGAGIGGNKVYDLYLRMEDDVLAKNPDVVVIWIGVNDVWHKSARGTGTDPDKFEKFYNAIIRKLKERNITVFMCTPSTIGEKTDMSNQQDGDLNQYSNIIRSIARKNNIQVIDFRKMFLDYGKANNPENKERGILTTDGVHLNNAGNLLVAEAMVKSLAAMDGR